MDEEASDLFSVKGREALAKLELATEDRRELERKLEVLDELDRHIEILGKWIASGLKTDARAELLMSLPGVGKLTAYGLLAEVGDFGRFPNRRALASYAGLLPVPNESGDKEYERHTAKQCNRHLRWTLLEAVSGAVRGSPRMAALYSRVKARNVKRPGKARVALARELAELAHLLVNRGVPYQERPPARPGSELARPSPRPADKTDENRSPVLNP